MPKVLSNAIATQVSNSEVQNIGCGMVKLDQEVLLS